MGWPGTVTPTQTTKEHGWRRQKVREVRADIPGDCKSPSQGSWPEWKEGKGPVPQGSRQSAGKRARPGVGPLATSGLTPLLTGWVRREEIEFSRRSSLGITHSIIALWGFPHGGWDRGDELQSP